MFRPSRYTSSDSGLAKIGKRVDKQILGILFLRRECTIRLRRTTANTIQSKDVGLRFSKNGTAYC